ncbi:hypothetical protein ABIE27_006014 [Paenibacillus sp. 4624]|uniref:replicative helicase loader/inhibitor n=1 Tax=Paenibacillus sp. 4624 TaxID=3156453 RepID=UPI003D244B89
MKETETIELMSLIITAYPQVELNDDIVNLWIEMLSDISKTVALQNLKHHIKTSKWPPTIADIRANTSTTSDILRIETQQCFALMESWEQNAVPLLKSGDDHE